MYIIFTLIFYTALINETKNDINKRGDYSFS